MKEYREFSRQPRFIPELPGGEIEIQNPPSVIKKDDSSWVLTLMPSLVMILVTVLIATMTKSVYTLISVAMTLTTVITTVIGSLSKNKKVKDAEKNRREKYLSYINDIRSELGLSKKARISAMTEMHPAPAECIERIRTLGEDSNQNQTTVAKAIHVAQTTYSDYEKGKVRIPLECLIELARFYNVDINYIAGVSDVKNEFPKK